MKFRVIIAGGRDFNDYNLLERKVNALLTNYTNEDVIILSGRARGADKLGEQYAEKHNIDIHYFEPDWDEYGKRAGIMRNIEMGDNADALIAFWDGVSKGTSHMIDYATKIGLKVRVVNY